MRLGARFGGRTSNKEAVMQRRHCLIGIGALAIIGAAQARPGGCTPVYHAHCFDDHGCFVGGVATYLVLLGLECGEMHTAPDAFAGSVVEIVDVAGIDPSLLVPPP